MTCDGKKVLLLRTCAADMTSHGGFRWPESGPVSCPDWDPSPACGGGLFGLLWGEGNGFLLDWSPSARWLVWEADADSLVPVGGDKVKAPAGRVVFCGGRYDATAYLAAHGGLGCAIVGATAAAGDWGIAAAGHRGTATAGYWGTAAAGDLGTATAGDWGTATAGHWGTASVGYGGTATAGYGGTAAAGYGGTAAAGDEGKAAAGDWGTAAAGHKGKAAAGDRGAILINWFDANNIRRIAVGYVGEDGIKPDTPYRCKAGRFVEAVKPPAEF